MFIVRVIIAIHVFSFIVVMCLEKFDEKILSKIQNEKISK